MTIVVETMFSLCGFLYFGGLSGATPTPYYMNFTQGGSQPIYTPGFQPWPDPNGVPSAEIIEETQSAGDSSFTGVDFSLCPQNTVAFQIYPGPVELQFFFTSLSGNGTSQNPFLYNVTFQATRVWAHIPPAFTVEYNAHFVTHTYNLGSFTPGASGMGPQTVYGPFSFVYGDPTPVFSLVSAYFHRNLTDYFNNA